MISNNVFLANFSAFEVEEESLGNLQEYSLANTLFWALAEGHACEMSSRRNAMDVRYLYPYYSNHGSELTKSRMPPRTLVR